MPFVRSRASVGGRFLIASFTAALQQLRQTTIEKPAAPEDQPAPDVALFAAIAAGDAARVQTLLTQANAATDVERLMCHPLCDCAKCVVLVAQARAGTAVAATSPTAAATIYARDALQRTPLHVAVRWRHVDVVR